MTTTQTDRTNDAVTLLHGAIEHCDRSRTEEGQVFAYTDAIELLDTLANRVIAAQPAWSAQDDADFRGDAWVPYPDVTTPEPTIPAGRLPRDPKAQRVSIEIPGHGRYSSTTRTFDCISAEYAHLSIVELRREVEEVTGCIGDGYHFNDLKTRTELLFVLADTKGAAYEEYGYPDGDVVRAQELRELAHQVNTLEGQYPWQPAVRTRLNRATTRSYPGYHLVVGRIDGDSDWYWQVEGAGHREFPTDGFKRTAAQARVAARQALSKCLITSAEYLERYGAQWPERRPNREGDE